MNNNELPETITSDPRIGQRVHILKDNTIEQDGVDGVIESIFLFDDGYELFNIEGVNGVGYMLAPDEFEFEVRA